MILAKRRLPCSVVAASLLFVSAISALPAYGADEQDRAQPGSVVASTARAGDVVASIEAPREGHIGNRVIDARWQLDVGRPNDFRVRDPEDGHVVQLMGPFRLELADGHVFEATTMTLLEPGRVEELAPNPNSTVAAEQLPGTAVHYRLGGSRWTGRW